MTLPQSPRFTTAVAVEARKLRHSLILPLALVAPALVAVFCFFNMARLNQAAPWTMHVQSATAIWAFFMLPMSVTALTALVAHLEHGPRSWDYLRALPLPRWHLYGAKAACVMAVVGLMTLLLGLLVMSAVELAGMLKPAVAATGPQDVAGQMALLGRVFLSSLLLVAVQLWIALRHASFVPALAVGIGGTFFAVVASSARIGLVLPWQIPINQLASDPARARMALAIGLAGGIVAMGLMLWRMDRRDTPA